LNTDLLHYISFSHIPVFGFFYNSATAPSVPRPPHYWIFMIILRHTMLRRTTLGGWSAWCRDLYLTAFNKRNIYSPNRIQNQNPSKWTAVDPCLKPCGHWDRFWFSELRKCWLVCYKSTLTIFWQYLIKIIINKINDNHIANKNNSGLIYCL
jgi:hypothetical protein